MKTIIRVFLCSLVLALSSNAQARDIDWLLQGNLDFGGDELVEVFYVGGGSEKIKAGELMQMSFGTAFGLANDSSLEGQLTVGWKFDVASADNGEVTFERYPVELLLFGNSGSWRYGGGFAYHLNPSLTGEDFFAGLDVDFDDALGFILQLEERLFNSQFYLGGRITLIKYEIGNASLDGDSIGMIFTAKF